MKASVLSVIVVGALLAGFAPAQPAGQPTGQPPQRGDAPPGPRGPREGGQSVEGAMKSMNRAFRTVRQNVAKTESKEQVLAAINQMQAGAVAAKGQTLKGDGSPADVAAKNLEFRRAMIDLVKALIQLETDVLDGKSEAAVAGVEKIQTMREDMHKKMGVKDDDEGTPPPPRGQ